MTTEWLRDIEQKVEAAAQALINLRRTVKSLEAEVRRLEKDLISSQEANRAGRKWTKNHALIRTRVENLIDGLERLDHS
ncbi:MAG: hypothetical protein V3S30_10910 [Thermoanaerobaculia bacterium]